MSIIHKLDWRYATKEFDSEKKVSEEDITELLKATNLSASSYGLQPYEFIVIHDQELQNQLVQHTYGQTQIANASHVIVMCAKTSLDEEYISKFISHTEELRGLDSGSLSEYKSMMINSIGSAPASEQLVWAQKQCYTALGTLLLAAADLKIDACPMEGFNPDEYNNMLNLTEKGLHATLVIPVGYRSRTDSLQNAKKVRRPLAEMISLYYSS